MCAVAVGAGCRNDEATLEQAASVHTILVAADDIGDVRLDIPPEPEPEPENDLGAIEGAAPSEEDSLREGLVEAELYLKYGMEDRAAEKLRDLTDRARQHHDGR